jgi:hypothetical protein
MPTLRDLPPVDFTFVREHGVHQFELIDGDTVTAISQPTWGAFAYSLGATAERGSYVVSPELIVASPESRDPEATRLLAARRIEQTKQMSWQFPQTTVLLGALTFDTPRPRNELLFIRGGQEVGRTPKMPYSPAEASLFHQAYDPAEQQQPDPHTLAIICSDLLFHRWRGSGQELEGRDLGAEYVDPIGPEVRTLLVSACWITPFVEGIKPEHETARFITPLRFAVGSLMHRHPNLQDVVMADQLPPGTPASGPVNFHARRAVVAALSPPE